MLQAEADPSLGIKTSPLFQHTQLVIVTYGIEVETACDLFDVLVQGLREEPLGEHALWGVSHIRPFFVECHWPIPCAGLPSRWAASPMG